MTPTMSVENKSNGIIFLNGLFVGAAKSLINKLLYLSSKPLTNKPRDPTFVIPVIFVRPSSTSLTPFLDNSCAPILCFITTAFFCSSNNALSFSLLTVDFTTTSLKLTLPEQLFYLKQ